MVYLMAILPLAYRHSTIDTDVTGAMIDNGLLNLNCRTCIIYRRLCCQLSPTTHYRTTILQVPILQNLPNKIKLSMRVQPDACSEDWISS